MRGEDFVARIGGDEFVIVAPADANSDFDMLARRILRATDQPMILPGPIVATVGMSIGIAVLEPGTDPAAVFTLADRDMYRMKSRHATATSAADSGRHRRLTTGGGRSRCLLAECGADWLWWRADLSRTPVQVGQSLGYSEATFLC